MPIFFLALKGSIVLIKIMKLKMGVTVLVFAAGQHAQKVCTTCISFDF